MTKSLYLIAVPLNYTKGCRAVPCSTFFESLDSTYSHVFYHYDIASTQYHLLHPFIDSIDWSILAVPFFLSVPSQILTGALPWRQLMKSLQLSQKMSLILARYPSSPRLPSQPPLPSSQPPLPSVLMKAISDLLPLPSAPCISAHSPMIWALITHSTDDYSAHAMAWSWCTVYQVLHSLVTILCDHDNTSKGTMDRAHKLCTQFK